MSQKQLEVSISFNKVSLIKILKNIIFGGVFLSIFFPIFGDYGNLLYPIGREIFFRILVETIFVCWILLAILDRSYLPKRSILFYSLCSFLFIFGLSTIFSADPKFSFWGNFYRGTGFFSMLHFLLFFIITSSTLKEWVQWKKIIYSAIFISLPIALTGIIQYFLWIKRDAMVSTLNNVNFLSAYLLLIFFFSFYFGFLEKNKYLKIAFLSISFVQLTAIIMGQSRGSILGLFLGILFLIIMFWKHESAKIKKVSIIASIFLFFILVGAFTISPIRSSLEKNQLIYRVAEGIESIKTGGRLEAWKSAVYAISVRPLLGYGPENFNIPFDLKYKATQETESFVNTFFDKGHSFLAEYLATIGILGLLSYLFVLFSAFFLLAKIKTNSNLKLIVSATFVAYLSQNLFNIDTTTSLIYFFFWLAFTQFIFFYQKEPLVENESNNILTKKQKVILVAVLIVLIPLFIFSLKNYHLDFLQANYYNNLAERSFAQKKYQFSIDTYEKALKNHWTYMTHDLEHKYASFLMQLAAENPRQSKEFALRALDLINKAIENQPYFVRTWMLGGVAANFFINLDNTNQVFKDKADYYFKKSTEMSPGRPFTWLSWAESYIAKEDYKSAREKVEKAKEIYPTGAEPEYVLGLLDIYENNPQGTKEHFKISQEKFIKNGPSDFNPIGEDALTRRVKAYIKIKDLNSVAKTYNILRKINPNNIQYWISLAVTQKEMKNFIGAKQTIEELYKKFPQTKNDTNIKKFYEEL